MSVKVAVILARKGSDVLTITSAAPLRDAVTVLAEHNIGALVVCDEPRRIAGIVSERDIVRHLAGSRATLDAPVSDVMTADVLTCTPETSADEVMQTMTTLRARHLPVVDADGDLVGVVSIGDVVKSRIDDLETQTESMQAYISGGPY